MTADFESSSYGSRSGSRLLDELSTMPHGIIGIVASGKMGKSALAFTIADMVPGLRDRPHFLYETFAADLSCFPGFTCITDLDDAVPGSVVIIEDLGRIFAARGSAQNSMLPRWLGIISHKSIVVIFTIQNLSDADISLFRSQNFIELHKLMWDEDIEFERSEFREAAMYANLMIRRYSGEHPEIPVRSMVFSPRYSEVSAWPLVPWWSDECAHFLRDVRINEGLPRRSKA